MVARGSGGGARVVGWAVAVAGAVAVAVAGVGCGDDVGAGFGAGVVGEELPLSAAGLDEAARGAPVPVPLPVQMALSVPAVVPGDTVFVSVSGADPGASVKLLRGSAGGMTCPAVLGGGCVSLGSASILASANANAVGEAAFAIVVPVSVPVGVNLDLQAVVGGANAYASDVVRSTTVSVCGDTIQQSDEECDDGGVVPGDGCSATCAIEVGVDDFTIRVISAVVANRNPASGLTWDLDPFGIFIDPDVYFVAYVDGTEVYASNTANDDRTPRFNDSFPATVPAGSELQIDFWDEDPIPQPEYVGTLLFDHADLNLVVGTGVIVASDFGLTSVDLEVQ